jgi:hypothetical protein
MARQGQKQAGKQKPMKLAEALMIRADAQKKLTSLRERISRNAVVQQGEKPHEDPTRLLNEAAGVLQEIEQLIDRINRTNQSHRLADGRTLAAAIARRDTLVKQHSLLESAIAGSKKEPERYSMSEIKWVATVDVGKLQKQSDDLAGKIREINALIQSTNWQVDLI